MTTIKPTRLLDGKSHSQTWKDSKWNSTYKSNGFRACHNGPQEIIPNLWIGSYKEVEDFVSKPSNKVDIVVPLNDTNGTIWNRGWRGQIHYVPCTDFGVLPKDVAESTAEKIYKWTQRRGKRVAMYCMGGHGRTGYIAALVLHLRGEEDPIEYIREKYCKSAVESRSQIDQIADITNNPKLKEHKPKEHLGYTWGYSHYTRYEDLENYDDYDYKFTKKKSKKTSVEGQQCFTCLEWYALPEEYKGLGWCSIHSTVIDPDEGKKCLNHTDTEDTVYVSAHENYCIDCDWLHIPKSGGQYMCKNTDLPNVTTVKAFEPACDGFVKCKKSKQ